MWWLLASPASAAEPFLPLVSLAYDIRVAGPLAELDLVQTFRNGSDQTLDAVYVFPLPPGAVVDGLELRIDTREIHGEIRPRAAARAAWEAARLEGRTAALTEELRTGVFTQDVAHLPPGEAVEVRVRVVVPLAQVGDHWSLAVPLLTAPRFVPLGTRPVPASWGASADAARDVGVRARIRLTVDAGASVRTMWAAPEPEPRPDVFGSHATWLVTAAPLTADLLLAWRTARDAPVASLLVSDEHALVTVESRGPVDDLRIDWGACAVEDPAPAAPPPVRPGAPSWVLARRRGPCDGPVVVHGRGPDGPLAMPVTPRYVDAARALAATWARARVEELLASGADERAVRALGLAWQIVTPETSFVAVDRYGAPAPAPASPPEAWPVSVFDRGFGAIDTSSATRGEVVTKQFLQKIPSGRSYQSAVQTVAGTQAGSGGNPNLAGGATDENTYLLDGANVSEILAIVRADPGSSPPSPLRSLGLALPTGTNRTAASVSVGGTAPLPSLPTAALSASVSGPIRHDHVWWAASAVASRVAPEESAAGDVDTLLVRAALTAVPSDEARLTLSAVADPGAVALPGARIPFGGETVQLRLDGDLTARTAFASAVTGQRRALGLATTDRVSAASTLTHATDGHTLSVGVEPGVWSQSVPGRRLSRAAFTAFASDRWDPGRWIVDPLLGVEVVGPTALATPRLQVGYAAGRTRAQAGVGRAVDALRVLPADLSPTPPLRDEARARLSRELVRDLEVFADASVARERLPFVAPPSLQVLPEGPVPTVDRVVPTVAIGFAKPWARRWGLDTTFTWHPAPGGTRPGEPTDALAPYVPGFLDALRPWRLDASVGWDVPTDPWTLRLSAFASLAPAIDADGPWWLRRVRSVGGTLAQDLDVRRGAVTVSGTVAWLENDVARAVVPLELAFLAPGSRGFGERPALRIQGALSWGF